MPEAGENGASAMDRTCSGQHLPSAALEKLRQGHTHRYEHEKKHTFTHIGTPM